AASIYVDPRRGEGAVIYAAFTSTREGRWFIVPSGRVRSSPRRISMPMTLPGAVLALLLPGQAQVPKEPAKDLFLRSAKVPGVEIRFVDYHWQPAIFEAMASGKGDVPEAKRNWVVVRVILDARPLTLEGKRLAVGNYALALWPNLDGK